MGLSACVPWLRVSRVALCVAVALATVGCQGSETTTTTAVACEGELVGDVDGDGGADRVQLCGRELVVEGIASAAIEPLEWPGTNPRLLLLAEIDGQPGLETVVEMSPANAYEPGAVFTVRDDGLARMRFEGGGVPELVPLDDEFPAGVDCAGRPGRIVVTSGDLERGTDRYWRISRSVLQASQTRFELVRRTWFRVRVGPEAERRWPELGGHPFRSCPATVRPRPARRS
jgi:hypothetical protein